MFHVSQTTFSSTFPQLVITYWSLIAKVRPESERGAAGGGGWGNGRSSSLSTNAPKSSLLELVALIQRRRSSARIKTPATPITAHNFGFGALGIDSFCMLKFGKRQLKPRNFLNSRWVEEWRRRLLEMIAEQETGF